METKEINIHKYEKVIELFKIQCAFYNNALDAYKSLNIDNQKIIKKIYPNIFGKQKNNKNKAKHQYYSKVWEYTEINCLKLEGIEKRCFKKYDIDHIVPISYGFKNNIPAELIGGLSNLRILSNKENLQKGNKLTDDSKEVLNKWNLNKTNN